MRVAESKMRASNSSRVSTFFSCKLRSSFDPTNKNQREKKRAERGAPDSSSSTDNRSELDTTTSHNIDPSS